MCAPLLSLSLWRPSYISPPLRGCVTVSHVGLTMYRRRRRRGCWPACVWGTVAPPSCMRRLHNGRERCHSATVASPQCMPAVVPAPPTPAARPSHGASGARTTVPRPARMPQSVDTPHMCRAVAHASCVGALATLVMHCMHERHGMSARRQPCRWLDLCVCGVGWGRAHQSRARHSRPSLARL